MLTIIKKWESIEKDPETKEIVSRSVNTISKDGSRVIFESEEMIDIVDTTEEVKFHALLSEMNKDQFRKAIAAEINSSDFTLVNKLLKSVIRYMRKNFGGLQYTQANIKLVHKFYKS